ncbi:MAG: glycoside hydrolase family 2 TIM barrel-domain containing protein, partial [Bacteroidota bacterium]
FMGDAVPNSLQWKDAWQLKQMGINSVRLAHYPHDNSFIEACDELGLLVYEEPPTWIGIGNQTWLANLEEATRRMVRNHRNHPSIIMWGAAINHRGPVERLHYACKEEDPTRFTGSNGAPWTGPQQSGATDVYAPMDYGNLPIGAGEFTYLCEHGSTMDGLWNQDFVSRSKGKPNMIGVAAWTAHDYQTFKPKPLGNPNRPFSIDRVPNPVYFWYQSETLSRPMVHIADQRVSKDGQVVVFSNAQRVELYQDGKLLSSQFPDQRAEAPFVSHPNFTFHHDWNQGVIKAVAYLEGQAVATHQRSFPGSASQLSLEIERDQKPFFANGSDVKTVNCYLLDAQGERVITAENRIQFQVEGQGALIEASHIDANPRTPFYGVATAYLRSTPQAGPIVVRAYAKGLGEARDTIYTEPYQYDQVIATALPIYELKHDRIDLSAAMNTVEQEGVGGFEFGEHQADQISSEFLQFGWQSWTGQEGMEQRFPSPNFDCTYALSATGAISWFSGWGQTGQLPYLSIDGLSVAAGEALNLEISSLPEGTYELVSYHHGRQKINRPPKTYQVAWKQGSMGGKSAAFAPSMGDLYTAYPSRSSTRFHSDGEDPVVITFRSEKDLDLVLNGFELKEILE